MPRIHFTICMANQLVFGRNPNLLSLSNDQLPALEGISTREIVADNLNAMHFARKAFIECEVSEKLRRALRHQVRTSITDSYKNGDLVLYRRSESDRWLGPCVVIGWENKVLVKNGGTYVRVHLSCLILYPELHQNTSGIHDTSVSNKPQSQDNEITKESIPIYNESDTDDNLEQIQADVCDKPSKMLTKSVKLLLNHY